ncbi:MULTISPECIES: glycosyltransferase family 2 protein [unclassified Butyrivibrio]|uniref:glycosyltransferase family 2 protein n=1 Tax=unclassified Butyrivibrio TaxID=2639466 RepID=UPI00042244CE|nr:MULTISPECIES: glycosyltransferase family 2 protein [unclassified Butyrivibrio]SEL06496.1 Glycosyltransferase involved in cell wall bisynthesis [Butyrivibrio sp. ob235]
MENKTIPIIIPAYEPDEKLIKLLSDLKASELKPVVIVDDGSDKDTYGQLFETAKSEYGAVVLRHAVNMGKGRALKDAFNYCLNEYPDMIGVITADSDGQHTTTDITRVKRELLENSDALILGCRNFDEGGIPARSVFGNKTTSKVMGVLTGVKVTDTQTGLRAIPAGFMRYLLNEKGERFEFETNMLLATGYLGIPIRQVDIQTIYIEENKSSHFRPIKDSLIIYAVFFKFIISSLSSSVIDMLMFALFCRLFRNVEDLFIGYILLSTILARVISATYNFMVNYKVVFKGRGNKFLAAAKYLLLAVIIMLLSGYGVTFIHGFFESAPEVYVKIPVDTVLFLLSFVIQREFVYK